MCYDVFHECVKDVEYLIELNEEGILCSRYETDEDSGRWVRCEVPDALFEKYSVMHMSVFG